MIIVLGGSTTFDCKLGATRYSISSDIYGELMFVCNLTTVVSGISDSGIADRRVR